MKICIAQTRPAKGDVPANSNNHKKFIKRALSHGTDMIVFPELSLTGYEPTLAKELATTKDDRRFQEIQDLSDSNDIIIGAGMPIKADQGILIGMIIFQPHQPRQTYFKQHIHQDEEPHFINGPYQSVLGEKKIALAICYEISIASHAEQSHNNGAEIYIASVAKTAAGVKNAMETLSQAAKKYSMTTLMSNCVGMNDGDECAGRSSVWNCEGQLMEQLNDRDEGMIIFDTETQEFIKEQGGFHLTENNS